jgi:hypothetical protein
MLPGLMPLDVLLSRHILGVLNQGREHIYGAIKAPPALRRGDDKRSCAEVIMQVWISTHFGVLSEQLPVADENSLFIKATFTPTPVPR